MNNNLEEVRELSRCMRKKPSKENSQYKGFGSEARLAHSGAIGRPVWPEQSEQGAE